MGKIFFGTGPMFSGKSAWLIQKLTESKDKKTIAIKHATDDRYNEVSITTHDGKEYKSFRARNTEEVKKILQDNPDTEVLGIDEIQFYEPELVNFLVKLRSKGLTIFVSGLNLDYLAVPWKITENLQKIADQTVLHTAICSVCKKQNALYSQRIGESDDRVAIGGIELYEPRCEQHYQRASTT